MITDSYFADRYFEAVTKHKTAIKNWFICHKELQYRTETKSNKKSTVSKAQLKRYVEEFDHDLRAACCELDLMNDLLKRYPVLDTEGRISQIYDPHDFANCGTCSSCSDIPEDGAIERIHEQMMKHPIDRRWQAGKS